jgi:hypothetical protein
VKANIQRLARELARGTSDERIAALKEMRDLVSRGKTAGLFELALRQVASEENDVRWQSLIVIGEFIPLGAHNERIWSLILEYCGIDDDMQSALATVLLEHLLEHDFERTLDKIRGALEKSNPPLLDLVPRCGRFGESDSQWRRLQDLIAPSRGGGTRITVEVKKRRRTEGRKKGRR